MVEEKIYEEKEDFICSVCSTSLQESEVIKRNDILFCADCWNEKVKRDRKVLSMYAFFVVFFLFQLFFFILPFVHETRGFPSLIFIVLCVVIGVLCGMIAYEEVYARMSKKLLNNKNNKYTTNNN
ncbi:hypothetical protein KAX75_10940 [candidate division WOR-3 bacterium]|nr:hypothetical protein [candidate division WOR-3 bacterium]